MKLLLRIVAAACIVIAAVLVGAVIAALGSDGGAKPGVAVAYIVGSIILVLVAIRLWRRPATPVGPAA